MSIRRFTKSSAIASTSARIGSTGGASASYLAKQPAESKHLFKTMDSPTPWRRMGERRTRAPVATLTACGQTHAAFDRRSIPAEPLRFAAFCVAFRSKYTRYSSLTRLVSRAPHRPRRSRGFHHRLLTACGQSHAAFDRRSIPAETRRSSLRFGRNTPGIPPSRALSAGRLTGLGTHVTLSTGC